MAYEPIQEFIERHKNDKDGLKYPKTRKSCPFKLSVPELPQGCIGSRCMWFMNYQDECTVKMLARIAGRVYPIGKAK